jgi:hypothetical protein
LGVERALERWVASRLGGGRPVRGLCAVGRTRAALVAEGISWFEEQQAFFELVGEYSDARVAESVAGSRRSRFKLCRLIRWI